MIQKIKSYFILVRLHQPIGIFLLLWPTLWGLWLASEGSPNRSILAVFVIGVLIMRSAGCIVNDIADRKWDGFVERTARRPLVTGSLTVTNAVVLCVILLLCAFSLVLLLNTLTIQLACLGLLLTLIYPFLKRVTHLPQLCLGVAFTWGIPMAFAAECNTVTSKAWVLFFAAAIWPVIYDTFYAMSDRPDDIKIGVRSTAILFGRYDKWVVAILQMFFLLLMVEVGVLFSLNFYYYLGLLFSAFLFLYQQLLTHHRTRESCFRAFLNNNWVGFIIFLGIVLSQR